MPSRMPMPSAAVADADAECDDANNTVARRAPWLDVPWLDVPWLGERRGSTCRCST
jgi:hypothetical protein